MRNKSFILITLLITSGIFLFGTISFAESIKSRMKARKPVIEALKAQGIVGENNRGYLEFVGANREKADIINAENNDREKVYTAIAGQQGTAAELVGKRRAVQIKKKAKTGQWFQDQNGKWYKK